MMVDIEECYIMQYTGLKDKSGKEIYEGIVKTSMNTESRNIYARCGCWFVSMEHELGYYQKPKEVEVIGNKYEKPQLLTTKEN